MKDFHKSTTFYLVALLASIVLLSLYSIFTSSLTTTAASYNDRSLSIVLIGDSYTAGNGIGSYNGPVGSYRSSKNWGNIYNNWLKSNGVRSTLTNVAWSGKKTDDINLAQIPEIPQNTDLVMFTAGGNDAEFSEVIKRCFATGFRSTHTCRNSIYHAKSELPSIIESTKTILKSLETKLPSTSEVVLVGYPLLSLENVKYDFKTCELYNHEADYCLRYDRYDAVNAVRDTGKKLNELQAEMVREWNGTSSLKVSFIDIQNNFATHEPNPNTNERNPRRWISEFLEKNGDAIEIDGKESITSSLDSYDKNKWYHPNIIGHRKIALDIIDQFGMPSSVKEITATSNDIDITFVIDTTGSMGEAIYYVRQDVFTIAEQIQNMSGTSRFSLVSYQDHPSFGGQPSDYPAKTHLNFNSDISWLHGAFYSLKLGYGGDWEESMYSGAMAGLDQSWRPGVRKIMIIIGDAPSKDPEPITNYTWKIVAQRAYDIDPVEIYAIDVGNGGLSTPEILQMTNQSGGKIINANDGDIPKAIIDTIGESIAKPFGWIQGPYVTRVGESVELDGRGSYAVGGEITKIEWDLDGDSIFETESSSLLYTHTFNEEFGGTIGIRITDSNGNMGIGSTRLDVSDDGDAIAYGADNCPLIANQNQADSDNDGIGDDCDDDIGWPTEDMPGTYVTYGDEEDSEITETTSKSTSPRSASTATTPSFLTTPTTQFVFTQSNQISSLPEVTAETNKNPNKFNDYKNDKDESPSGNQTNIVILIIVSAVVLAAVILIGLRSARDYSKS